MRKSVKRDKEQKPDCEKEKEIFFLGQSGDEGIFEKINSNLDDRGTL